MIEAGWLACVAVIPAFFNVYSSRVFEPDKLTLLRVIVLVMAVAWLVKKIETATETSSLRGSLACFLRFSPFTVPVLIFAFIYVMATLVSITPAVSFWGSYQRMQGTLVNLCYVTLFLLTAYNLRTRNQFDRLVNVILFTSLPVSFYAMLQHQKLDPLPWGGDVTSRVTSSMGNSIFLAAYLIMVIPLTISRLFSVLHPYLRRSTDKYSKDTGAPGEKKPLLVMLYTFILAIQLLVTLWTQSRGPWLGLLAGLAFMLIVFALRQGRRKLSASFLGLFVAITFLIVLMNVPGTPFNSLTKVSPYLQRLGTIADLESGTNKVRMLIWFGDSVGKGTVGLITYNPVRTLVGWGPESMYVAYNPFYPPDLAHLEARNATPDRSHNDFLDFLATMGVFGLASYLSVVGVFFYVGLKRLWHTTDLYLQLLLVALMGGVAAHLVESLTGIAIAATRTHFWVYVAVVAAIAALHRSGASSPTLETAKPMTLVGALEVPHSRPTLPASSTSQNQAKGRRSKQGKGTPQSQPSARQSQSTGIKLRAEDYQMIVYLATIIIGIPWLLTGNQGQRLEPSSLVLAGFVWLLLGLFVTAQWVVRPVEPKISWQKRNWWIYVPTVAITLFVCIFAFLSTVIADVHYKKGLSFENADRFDLAVPAYLDALRWTPTQDFYYLFLGRAYLELAKKAPDYKTSTTIDKINDLFSISPAQLQQMGRDATIKAAAKALEEAKTLAPFNTDNSANLGRLYQYWSEGSPDPDLRKERFEKALAYYEEASKLSPNTAHIQFEWGRVYHAQGVFDKATEKYQHALQLDAFYTPTYTYFGDIYRQTKEYDKAVEMYLQATTRDDSLVSAHSGLAFVYHEQGKLNESLDENFKALKYSAKDLASHRNIAIIYSELGDFDRSLEWADKTLKIAPQDMQPSIKAFIAELQSRKK